MSEENNRYKYSMKLLENIMHSNLGDNFEKLEDSVLFLEEKHKKEEIDIGFNQRFINELEGQRTVEVKQQLFDNIKRVCYFAKISNLNMNGEDYCSLLVYRDGHNNLIKKLVENNITYYFKNKELLFLTVYFDKHLGISIDNGGFFYNEIIEILEEFVDLKKWRVEYFRLMEDGFEASIKIQNKNKVLILEKLIIHLNFKDSSGFNLSHSIAQENSKKSSDKTIEDILNSIRQPLDNKSLELLSDLIELNYNY